MVLAWGPGVAIGVQEHLGVGVDGHEGLDVTVGPDKVHDGLDLRLGVSAGSMVDLRAGVAAGARSYMSNHNTVQKTV